MGTLLQSVRICCTQCPAREGNAGFAAAFAGNSLFANILSISRVNRGASDNISFGSRLRDNRVRFADFRDDIVSIQHSNGLPSANESSISAHGGVDDIAVRTLDTYEDPPEDHQSLPIRVCISIGIQIISRFFVSEIIAPCSREAPITGLGGLSDKSSSPTVPNGHNMLFGTGNVPGRFVTGKKFDSSCTRAEMYSRISMFQKCGGMALLVHLVINGGTFTPLCKCDKQFALWTMREIIVCSSEVNVRRINMSLQWLVWLLNCPVIVPGGPGMSSHSPRQAQSSSSFSRKPSSKNIHMHEYSELEWMPSARPAISAECRLMVLQEVRLLIGGDMLENVLDTVSPSLLVSEIARMPNKVFGNEEPDPPTSFVMPHLPDVASNIFENAVMRIGVNSSVSSSTGSGTTTPSHARGKSGKVHKYIPVAQQQSIAFSRVPISSATLKMHLVGCGILKSLFSLLFGDMCDASISEVLDSGFYSGNASASQDKGIFGNANVCELAVETWWSALGTLYLLILGSDAVKNEIDVEIGIDALCKRLFPFLSMSDAPSGIGQLVMELCVSNGNVAPVPHCPFLTVAKVPRLKVVTSLSATGSLSPPHSHGHHQNHPNLLNSHAHSRNTANETTPHPLLRRPQYDMLDFSSFIGDIDGENLFGGSCSDLISLSSVYYIRERSLAFMVDCLRPMKLKLSPHMSTAESTVGNSSSGIPRLIRSSSNTSNFSDVSVEETSKRSVGVHRDSSSHSLRDLEIVHDMMEIVPGNVGGTRGRSTSSSSSASSSSYHSASALLMFRNTLTKATPSPTPSLNGGVGAEKSSSFSRLGLPNKGGNFHAPSAHNSFVPLLRRLSGSLFPESHALFSVLESKLSEKYNIVRQATISPDIISDSDSCRNVPGSFGSTQLHMSCFSSSKPGTTGDIKMTSWRPCFSRVNLRNKESAELIFSMVLLTIGTELHMQLISLLSHLIDGNPENGRLIMKSTNLAVAVFELIGLMPDKQKGTFAYLLSQLLRYETNQQSLDMFMRYCRKMPCSNVDCIVILDELLAVKSCPELDDGCVDESKKELSSGQVVMTEDSADTDAADASIVSTLKPKSTSNMTHLLGYALQRADAQLQSQRESDVVDNSKSLVVKELLSQVLYILGRLVERDFPSAYIHFDHSSVILKNCLLFPRINIRRSSGTDQDLGTVTDSILSDPLKLKEECNLLGKKTAFRKMLGEYSKADGLSLCTWVRLGSLGDATIGTFMQFSGSTCGAGLDVGAGFGVHDTADSKLYNYVVDVYFRVVYRPTSIGDDERGSVASGISTLPGEMAHCEESSKRCLQLCMSFSFNEANTNPSNSESSVRDNEKLLDSLAGFGIPDVVIDYDWSEMGDWHLLYVNLANVSFSREESGTVKCFPNFSCGTRGVKIECFVDGEEKMVYYWNGEHGYCCNHAALACLYQPRARFGSHHSASSVNNGAWYNHHVQQQTISPSFPSVSCCTTGVFPWKCEYNSMDISLGGVHHEHAFIRKMIRSLALWSHGCVMGVGTFDEDVSSIEDLRLLQTYNSMVCGFSGTLSEVYVLLGDMNSQLLNSIYEKGASRSLCEFISSSHVATCLNVESVAAGLDAQQTAANIRSAENTGGLSTNNSTASASNLTANPAYLTESRGRSDIKNVTDSSGSKRSSSRSISPGLRSARMMHASDAVQNTHNPHSDSARVLSLSPAKHILPPGNGVSAVVSKEEVAEPPSSTSLVSELFTLFSSSTTTAPPADPNSSANNTRSNRGSWRGSSKDTASPLPRVSGCNLDALPQGAGSSILYDNGSAAFDGLLASSCGFQVYDTELVSDSFQHIGGIKALYPLLLVDRTRQIAGLRIIASLVASYEKNLSVLSGNELVKAENLDNFYAILYCLYSTPNHLSLESVQVLFELIVVSGEGKSVAFASTGATSSNCDKNKGSGLSNSSNSSKLGISPLMKQRAVPSAHTSVDIIHRPALLTLLVDVVVANPCKPHVAKGVIEWLKNICEDVEINIRTVLTEIGLVPFLIILCLWNVGDADLKIMTPFLGSQCDENKPLPNGEKHIKCGVPMSPSEASRLQSQVSKFIKQLICGTYGDPFNMPSGWISDSSSGSRPNPSNLHTTPTGFTVQHLASLLIFIGKISRDHTQYVAENHGETSSADTYRSNAATVSMYSAVLSYSYIIFVLAILMFILCLYRTCWMSFLLLLKAP